MTEHRQATHEEFQKVMTFLRSLGPDPAKGTKKP